MTPTDGIMRREVRIDARALIALVIGALLAAAVTATVMRSTSATADETDPAAVSSYQPIVPCRLADTRPPPVRVGPNAAFGADDTRVFDVSADGDPGECDPIGPEVTAIAMNVTALNATEQSFLAVWPGGEAERSGSSLNPAPGEPPTPNAVTTRVFDGSFSIYNELGTVDVVIDLVGLYTAAGPTDLVVVSDSLSLTFTSIGATSGTSVTCPEGTKAISGGSSVIVNTVGKSIGVAASIPSSNLGSWSGRAIANSSGVTTGTLNVYAVCAKNVTLAPD